MRLHSHESATFSSVVNSNVLIYWPHGFGDWVQLAYVLPFFEPSNQYWITRIGDDNVALIEGHGNVAPLFLGENSINTGDGVAYQIPHFGVEYSRVRGDEMELHLPLALYAQCKQHRIDTMFWSSFPETAGQVAYPYHSKARNLLPSLVRHDRLAQIELDKPLQSSLSLDVAPWVVQFVEGRLRNHAGFVDSRLCLIGRNGYTSVGKNWGHLWRKDLPRSERREGEECRQFMRLMHKDDPRWLFLVMEDRLFEGEHTVSDHNMRAFSYAELFGTSGKISLPFGIVMKALLMLADLFVGVPAGPYHLSMAKTDLPTVGIWTQHLPSWYDEPKGSAVHIVSKNVRDNDLDRRPGSFCSKGRLAFRLEWLDSRVIGGEEVMEIVEEMV